MANTFLEQNDTVTAIDWQPSASIKNLKLRAQILANIRHFFATRNVIEVETPVLSQYTVTDVHIESFQIDYTQPYFLQTSPEYAMKRLLAAGSGPIYQIGKAFRKEEAGKQHNPEFTLLEWYRPGFSHHQLMDEVDLLLQEVLHCQKAKRCSYQTLFLEQVHIDPLQSDQTQLQSFLAKQQLMPDHQLASLDKDTCLQLILSHCIEPNLGSKAPHFIFDFPASQAALATINKTTNTANRFEVYFHGVELANGFHELADPDEQCRRFQKDQQQRNQCQRSIPAIDQRFIAALKHGLPDCAGVALGIDRLIMLALKTNKIDDVLTFTWDQA